MRSGYSTTGDILSEMRQQNRTDSCGIASAIRQSSEKNKKAKLVALILLVVILALSATLVTLFFTGSPYIIYKDMQEQEYASAVSEYLLEVKNHAVNECLLQSVLSGEIDKAAENYTSGKWSCTATRTHLKAMSKMELDDASDKLREITISYYTVASRNRLSRFSDFYLYKNRPN